MSYNVDNCKNEIPIYFGNGLFSKTSYPQLPGDIVSEFVCLQSIISYPSESTVFFDSMCEKTKVYPQVSSPHQIRKITALKDVEQGKRKLLFEYYVNEAIKYENIRVWINDFKK